LELAVRSVTPPGKVSIGFGWPILLIGSGAMAWGWDGVFFGVFATMLLFILMPLTLAVVVSIARRREKK
jgi:hypothetical protein